jgi:cytochrome P450
MPETKLERPAYVPAHVPDELVWDHDLNAFARALDDPYRLGDHLRKTGKPMLYTRGATRGQPGWVPTTFAVMNDIFMDAQSFSSEGNVGIAEMLGMKHGLIPLEVDPPLHRPLRMVMQPILGPGPVAKLEPMVRGVCRELMGAFESAGGCDFMGDFATLFPAHVFLELTGLPPELLPQFFKWEHDFIRGTSLEPRLAAIRAIRDYLASFIDKRRKGETQPRNDIFDAVLNAEVQGRPLLWDEVMGICMTFYLGGLDTVIASLGWHMHYLATDAELQRRLAAQPDLIPGAVDDLYRAFGVTTTRRYVKRDVEFKGVTMKKGDRILMPTSIAGRDPAKFADPDCVDPERRPHGMTFATGIHSCIGMHLARREARYVLEEFLSRFRNIRIAAGKRPQWQTNGTWSFEYLPLEWDRI